MRSAGAVSTRGIHSRGGEGGVIYETVPLVNGSLDQLQTQDQDAKTILLLCYLDKICLSLTGGLWKASANLYSEEKL